MLATTLESIEAVDILDQVYDECTGLLYRQFFLYFDDINAVKHATFTVFDSIL